MPYKIYKTRTYIAGAWDEDADAIEQLYKWKNSDHWSFDFVDAHEFKQSRDTSNACSIKRSLCDRMQHSKIFVLVVGSKTDDVKSGSCFYCDDYHNGRCISGNNVSFDGFLEYECKKAVRDGMKIIVLYNSCHILKQWCPDILRDRGIHVAMKNFSGWNYSKVKQAFDYYS